MRVSGGCLSLSKVKKVTSRVRDPLKPFKTQLIYFLIQVWSLEIVFKDVMWTCLTLWDKFKRSPERSYMWGLVRLCDLQRMSKVNYLFWSKLQNSIQRFFGLYWGNVTYFKWSAMWGFVVWNLWRLQTRYVACED
jgi:hypothetical protein